MAKSGWGQRRSRRPDVDEEVQSSIGEVCTRMMPMTTMMSMELNEGVDGGNPLTQPVLPPSCLNPLADACDDHEDEIGEKK